MLSYSINSRFYLTSNFISCSQFPATELCAEQFESSPILIFHFFNVHVTDLIQSSPMSPKYPPLFKREYNFLFSSSFCTFRPSHSLWFYHYRIIWHKVGIMEPLPFTPPPLSLLSPGFLFDTLLPNTFNLCFFLREMDAILRP